MYASPNPPKINGTVAAIAERMSKDQTAENRRKGALCLGATWLPGMVRIVRRGGLVAASN